MQEEQLQVRSRRRHNWIARTEKINQEMPTSPEQKWALNFVCDWCLNKRKLKVFTLVDRFTREALAIGGRAPRFRHGKYGGAGRAETAREGRPQEIRVDNGTGTHQPRV